MLTSKSVQRAVRYALLSGSTALAMGTTLPALAAEGEGPIQEVIVTGSRIPQPNLTSISPVTTVTAESIRIEGVTRVEDLINNLPQAFADFGGNLANGATGAATVNLRNLGSQRTLVLINGRRLMPGDPTQNGAASPDINQIPSALIERVDVLTGGASAVYGADAVAGVTNFIMNDSFEGVRIDAQYGFYQHRNDNRVKNIVAARGFNTPDSNVTDGYSRDFNFIAGINTPDGKGNATVYVGYRQAEALRQSERAFSACALGSSNPAAGDAGQFTCGGSGTTAPGRFLPATGGDFTIGADNTFRPYVAATDQFNFAPDNFYQRPDERKIGGLFAHYDFSDQAKVYTEFMFMDDRTIAQIAASGAFLGGGPGAPPFFGNYNINCDNPLLSASARDALCMGATTGDSFVNIGRRNVEGGGRRDDLRHTSYRGVVGVKGDIFEGWNYDAYAQFGTTVLQESFQNDFSRARLNKALTAVVDTRPGSLTMGQTVCRVNADADLGNDDPACVPYNIFSLNGVTQDQLNYLQVPGLTEGETTETVVSASIAGDLGQYGIKLPTASSGLGVAFGAEYRSEDSELRADSAFQNNDLAGQGAPVLDTFGSFDVKELFVEARLPILENMPLAKSLSFEAGYRYSDYNLGFSTDSYKYGLDWAPLEDVRLRVGFQRASRSPNIQELFLQSRVQLDGSTDPCAGDLNDPDNAPTASAAACANTGVSAAQYGNILANPASQYNGLVGGNPNLDPEVSDTYTVGVVLTPAFLPNATLSIDYYDIKVEDLIGQIGADLIINRCLASPAGSPDPTFCPLVNRSATGSLWLGDTGFIIDPIVNTGSLQTKGIDIEANYRQEVGNFGSLGFNYIATLVDEFITEPLTNEPKFDCAGMFGTVCGIPIPEYRQKVRTTWNTPWNLDVSLTWRFIESVDLDATSSNPQLAGAVPNTDKRLGSRSYFDLSTSYRWRGVEGRLGLNNLLDKDPPLVGQANLPPVFGNGNTFPQVYDALGREVFISLKADF
jgi:outer membrane receptor protein involved in Fe transport